MLADAMRSAVIATVKSRAKYYMRKPESLDRLTPGLSTACPARIISTASVLLQMERPKPLRWFEPVGQVSGIHLRGAIIFARWKRRMISRERGR